MKNAPETRSGGFTPGCDTSMLTGENITVRILNIFMMDQGLLKYVSFSFAVKKIRLTTDYIYILQFVNDESTLESIRVFF
ncbi:hypothetical protein G7563_004991 [Salmonella enterica subsp. enterica]|nr:hypothetical protein [Salmonella enterica subsp. enterica serovar Hvittingfoss]